MAVTIEIGPDGTKIVDTSAATGPVYGPSFVMSLAGAEHVRERRSVATAVTDQALNFFDICFVPVFCLNVVTGGESMACI